MKSQHKDMQDKHAYVILGVDRASISAVSHLLSRLSDSHKQKTELLLDGKDLFFSANKKIFSYNDFAAYGIKTLSPELQSKEKIPHVHAAVAKTLKAYFSGNHMLVCKDLHTTQSLPFWREMFDHLHVSCHYILALSHPLNFARTYQRVTGYELELGLLLWLSHTMQMLHGTKGLPRSLVSCDLLLHHESAQLDRLARQLGVSVNHSPLSVTKDRQAEPLSVKDLRASQASKVIPLCVELYACLRKVAADDWQLESAEFDAKWREISAEYDRLFPMFCYLDRLLKKRRKLNRQYQDCRRSFVWKLTKPLRLIDDVLRKRRRQAKMKKKAIVDYA